MAIPCQNVSLRFAESTSAARTTESTSEKSVSDECVSALPYSSLVDEKGKLKHQIDLPDLDWEDLPDLKQQIEALMEKERWIPLFFEWAEEQGIVLGSIELRGSTTPFHLLNSATYSKKLTGAMGESIPEQIVKELHPPQDFDFFIKCEEGYDKNKLKIWFENQKLKVKPVDNGTSNLLAICSKSCDFLVYEQIHLRAVFTLQCLSINFDYGLSGCCLVSDTTNPMQPLVDQVRGIARFCDWNVQRLPGWLRLITATTRGCVCANHESHLQARLRFTQEKLTSSITNHHRSPLSTLAFLSNIFFYAPNFDWTLIEDISLPAEDNPLVALYQEAGPVAFHEALAACADWIYHDYLQPPPETSVRLRSHEFGKRALYELRIGTLTFHLPIPVFLLQQDRPEALPEQHLVSENLVLPQKDYLEALKLTKGKVAGPEALSEQLLASTDLFEVLLGGMISANPERVRKVFLNRLPDCFVMGKRMVQQFSTVLGEEIQCTSPIELWDYLKHNKAKQGLSRLFKLEQSNLANNLVSYITQSRSYGVDLLSRMASVEHVSACLQALPISPHPLGESLPPSICQVGEKLRNSENEEQCFFGCLLLDQADLVDYLVGIPPIPTDPEEKAPLKCLLKRLLPLYPDELIKACYQLAKQSPEKSTTFFAHIIGQHEGKTGKFLMLYYHCLKHIAQIDQIKPWAEALLPHLEKWNTLKREDQKLFIRSIYTTVQILSKAEEYVLVSQFCKATEKFQESFHCSNKFRPMYCVAFFAEEKQEIGKSIVAAGVKYLEKKTHKRYLLSVCEQHPTKLTGQCVKGLASFWWQTLREWPDCPHVKLRAYCIRSIREKLFLGEMPKEIQERIETVSYDSDHVDQDCKHIKSLSPTIRSNATFYSYIAEATADRSVSALIIHWVDQQRVMFDCHELVDYWKKVILADPIAAYHIFQTREAIPAELSCLLIPRLLENLPNGYIQAVNCLEKTQGDPETLFTLADRLLNQDLITYSKSVPSKSDLFKSCEKLYANPRYHITSTDHRTIMWLLNLLQSYLSACDTDRVTDERRTQYTTRVSVHLAGLMLRLSIAYSRDDKAIEEIALHERLNAESLWDILCQAHKHEEELLPPITYLFILLGSMEWLQNEIFESYGMLLLDKLMKWQYVDAIYARNALVSCLLNGRVTAPKNLLDICVCYGNNSELLQCLEPQPDAYDLVEKHLLRLGNGYIKDQYADSKDTDWTDQMNSSLRGMLLPMAGAQHEPLEEQIPPIYTLFGVLCFAAQEALDIKIMECLDEILEEAREYISEESRLRAKEILERFNEMYEDLPEEMYDNDERLAMEE